MRTRNLYLEDSSDAPGVYDHFFGRCIQRGCRQDLSEQDLYDSQALSKRLGVDIELCGDCLKDQEVVEAMMRGNNGTL